MSTEKAFAFPPCPHCGSTKRITRLLELPGLTTTVVRCVGRVIRCDIVWLPLNLLRSRPDRLNPHVNPQHLHRRKLRRIRSLETLSEEEAADLIGLAQGDEADPPV